MGKYCIFFIQMCKFLLINPLKRGKQTVNYVAYQGFFLAFIAYKSFRPLVSGDLTASS